MTPDQALHQQEIAEAILLFTEKCVDHAAGGVVHGEQDRELRSVLAQPAVVTAVQLDQHALLGHPLAAHPVLRRTPASRTVQSRFDQHAPQGSPAHVDSLSFTEQLREVSMIGSLVDRTSQMQRPAPGCFGYSIGWLAAPETVDQGKLLLTGGTPPVSAWYVAGSIP